MPGKEDEGREIMRWLVENVSRDLHVHIMEQYHPDAHVGKKRRVARRVPMAGAEDPTEIRYAEINRYATRSVFLFGMRPSRRGCGGSAR